MKRKGYTLIEVMCVVSILLIIFSFAFAGSKYYTNIKKDMEISTALYEIEDIMTYGKEYSIFHKVKGKVTIERQGNSMFAKYNSADGYEKKVNLGNQLKGYSDLEGETIGYCRVFSVSTEGFLEAGNLKLIASNGDKYKITIRVGVDLISVEREA